MKKKKKSKSAKAQPEAASGQREIINTLDYERLADEIVRVCRQSTRLEREEQEQRNRDNAFTSTLRTALAFMLQIIIFLLGILIISAAVSSPILATESISQWIPAEIAIGVFWVCTIAITVLIASHPFFLRVFSGPRWLKVYQVMRRSLGIPLTIAAALAYAWILCTNFYMAVVGLGGVIALAIVYISFSLLRALKGESDRDFLAAFLSAVVALIALIVLVVALVISVMSR